MEPLVEFGGEVEKAVGEVERVSGASLGDRGNGTGMAEVEKHADLRTGNGQLAKHKAHAEEISSASDRTIEENSRDVQRTGSLRETPT